jgi:Fe-S-cluster containining protein
MSPTRSQRDVALQAIYDRIPSIPDCQGRCWISCGPIDMSDRERQKIRQAGYKITPRDIAIAHPGTFYCDALTEEKRCAVYESRPLVCRLWGAVENMRCPYGCQPEWWLSDDEAYAMILESMRAGGGRYELPDSAAVRAALASAWFKDEMSERMTRGNRVNEVVPPAYRRKNR